MGVEDGSKICRDRYTSHGIRWICGVVWNVLRRSAGNFYSAAFAAAHQASVGGAEQMMDIVHTTTPAKYQWSSNPQALKGGIKAQAAQENPR